MPLAKKCSHCEEEIGEVRYRITLTVSRMDAEGNPMPAGRLRVWDDVCRECGETEHGRDLIARLVAMATRVMWTLLGG